MIYDRSKSLWDTTHAIESVNMSLRNSSKKWTMAIRDSDWKAALNRFTIQFEERLPQR